MAENIFLQVLIIFGFTIMVSYISALFRFPVIISFILSGFLIGPNGFGFISHSSLIDNMAEIGLAMLLFTIGLEFNKEKIKNVSRYFFLGGSLQVLLTFAILGIFLLLLNYDIKQIIFISFLLTLSSSALGFRILNEKRITHSLHGNLITGILLFQDITFVPMLMIIPLLAKKSPAVSFPLRNFFIYLLLFFVIVFLIKRYSEKIFRYLVKFHYRELNLMLAIFIPFAFSILSYKLGFSYALGAFIAGVLLSGSDFHLQIVSDIVPFKDIFNAFFFIAAGMLFELSSFLVNWQKIFLLIIVILLLKGLVLLLVAKTFKFTLKYAFYTALFLFQISEFSFVLAKVGWRYEIISKPQFDMLLTPLLIALAEKFLFTKVGKETEVQRQPHLKKHTVIAGYGLTGKNLTLALQKVHIPFLVVDLNYENVKRLKKKEFPVVFGDISSEEVLEKVNIREATIFVVAISDPQAAKIAISKARKKNPFLQIIARTRFLSEIENFYRIGANEVIGEEFETSIEIFSRTLHHYHIPTNVLENIIKMIRNQNYAILRGRSSVDVRWEKLNALIEAGTVETFLIDERMYACNKSLQELDLRKITEATIVALVRNGMSYPSPGADFVIKANDIVVLTAAHQNLEKAFLFLEKGEF
jgi:CPA2 family monovalent cation:H+ antiporter-2